MKDIDSILNNNDKDSVYYLSQCKKFCESKDWYNALNACEEGIKIDKSICEFYQRAIICCINMYDVKKAMNFLEGLKEVCFDKEKILPFSSLIEEQLKEITEKTQGNKDYNKVIDLEKIILSGGGKICNVSINVENPNNRFVFAKEDIKNAEVLIKIPRSLTITPARVEKTEIGKYFDSNAK